MKSLRPLEGWTGPFEGPGRTAPTQAPVGCGAELGDLSVERIWQVAVLAVAFIISVGNAGLSTDTWWVLTMGQLSVEQGRPVLEVVLAHGPTVEGVANAQWLAQVALYLLYAAFGEAGLKLSASLLVVASYGLLLATARAAGAGARVAVGTVTLAIWIGSNNLHVRAQLFSYLLFALLLFVLYAAGRRPRLLMVLPPLFALWANLHGAFFFGLVLVGLWLVGDLAERLLARRRGEGRTALVDWRSAIAFGASALAVLVNPLGAGVYSYLFVATGHQAARQYVAEWQPISLQDPFGQSMAISLLILVGVLWLGRRRLSPTEALLLVGFGYLALSSLRYVVWWGFVLVPILAHHAAALPWPSRRPERQRGEGGGVAARRPVNGLLAGMMVAWAGLSPFWLPALVPLPPGARVTAECSPAALADYLTSLPAGSRLYNYQPWSGYLAWRLWPAQQPMLDGRVEVHPSAMWDDYVAVSRTRPDWSALLDRYEIDYLVLERSVQGRLIEAAESDRSWLRLYEDGAAVVLGRRVG